MHYNLNSSRLLRLNLLGLLAAAGWLAAGAWEARAQGLVSLSDDAAAEADANGPNADSGAASPFAPAAKAGGSAGGSNAASLFGDAEDNAPGGLVTPAAAGVPLPTRGSLLPPDADDKKDSPLFKSKAAPAAASASATAAATNPADELLASTGSGSLFSQMSSLEKQTALLNLEFRKEKANTEIESLKLARQKALDEEEARREAEAQKKQEWENEQERLTLKEQQKLSELNAAYERLRQEKLLNVYKNSQIDEVQKWMETADGAYQQAREAEKEKEELSKLFAERMDSMKVLADGLKKKAEEAKERQEKRVKELEERIGTLNSRLAAAETVASKRARAGEGDNPFADGTAGGAQALRTLNDDYKILEIRGQGESILARLKNNANGVIFTVKAGTMLQSGHTIEAIDRTQITAERDGEKDYLYITGSENAVGAEPVAARPAAEKKPADAGRLKLEPPQYLMTNEGLPSLADGMFAK